MSRLKRLDLGPYPVYHMTDLHQLYNLPKLTDKLYLLIAKSSPQYIPQIPKKYRTRERYIKGIRKQPNMIYVIPDEELTSELCLEAVKLKPQIFYHVPHKYRSIEIYILALIKRKVFISQFQIYNVHENIQYDIFLGAVKIKPYLIKDVPKEYLRYELCLAAVNKNAYISIGKVPKEHLTHELCLIAYKQDPTILDQIDIKYYLHFIKNIKGVAKRYI